jgi:glycosyltransferase involved in cell wall biosynthesis
MRQLDFVFALNGIPIMGSGGTRILNSLITELKNLSYSVGVLIVKRDPWLKFLERNKSIPRSKTLLSFLKLNDTRFGYHFLNPIMKKMMRSPNDGRLNPDVFLFSKTQLSSFSIKYLIATNFVNGSEILGIETKAIKILFSQIDETDANYAGSYVNIAREVYSKFNFRLFLNEEMLKKFPNSLKTFVGIDHSIFRVITHIEERDPKKIIFILRPGKQKDPDTAIKSMHKIRSLDENIEISAYGTLDPNLVPNFVKYHYKPTNYDICRLLNSSSIFILTSTVEGMPLPPLEAMACGCAVISTECIGIREYIKSGTNGLLIPVGEPGEIANEVISLIQSIETRVILAKNGEITAREYNYKSMARNFAKTIKIFEELLGT